MKKIPFPKLEWWEILGLFILWTCLFGFMHWLSFVFGMSTPPIYTLTITTVFWLCMVLGLYNQIPWFLRYRPEPKKR